MSRSIGHAAVAYFGLVFTAGVVLGGIRVFVVAPQLGDARAVFLETPIMLMLSWLACGEVVRRFRILGVGSGLAMGVGAFGLLMAAELALSVFAFGRAFIDHVDSYRTTAGAAGLASQVAFGLMPMLRAAQSQLPPLD